ncbi:hypothetical protein B0H19DRAFT_1234236, partial [Mycena capillaripes]
MGMGDPKWSTGGSNQDVNGYGRPEMEHGRLESEYKWVRETRNGACEARIECEDFGRKDRIEYICVPLAKIAPIAFVTTAG